MIRALASAALLAAGLALAAGAEPVAPSILAQRLQGASAPLVLDVRSGGEYAAGHVPGALNIPIDELPARLGEISGRREVVVYCERGTRAGRAETLLANAGYRVRQLEGSMQAWRAAELPVER